MTGCSLAQGSGSGELNSPRARAALSNADAQLALVSSRCCSMQVRNLDQLKEPSKKEREREGGETTPIPAVFLLT